MSRLFETRPGDDGLPGPERRLAVLALILGTLMAVVDTTMVNIALPSIARSLEVSASRVVWVTNLFQVSCAAFLLVFAALSELLSRRRLYVAGVAVFALAALGSALSTSLESLLVFRALQGLGAAATLSIGPSIYRQIFPTRLLGSALGLSAMVVAGGYAAGPAIGGLLLSVADWPWLFALHLPLGAVALVLAWRALPRESARPGGFDWQGALLSVAMLGGFFVAMDGLGHGMPVWALVAWLGSSLVAALLFLRRQRRAPTRRCRWRSLPSDASAWRWPPRAAPSWARGSPSWHSPSCSSSRWASRRWRPPGCSPPGRWRSCWWGRWRAGWLTG